MSKEVVLEKEEVELGMGKGNFLDSSDVLSPTCLRTPAWQLAHGWTGNDLYDWQLEDAFKADQRRNHDASCCSQGSTQLNNKEQDDNLFNVNNQKGIA